MQHNIQVVETFVAGPLNLVSGINDLQLFEIGGQLLLYGATRAGGGVIAVQATQTMSLIDQVNFSIVSQLPVGARLDLITVSGNRHLVVSGSNQSAMLTYRLDADGLIGAAVKLSGSLSGVISAQSFLTLGGTTYCYAARTEQSTIHVYSLSPSGAATLVQQVDVGLVPDILEVTDMLGVASGGNQFLLTLSAASDSVTSYGVNGNGTLVRIGALGTANGLGIADPSCIRSETIGGQTYVFLASASSSSISVMTLDAAGRLRVTDHVIDTLGTRFQGVQALATAVVDQRGFLVAGGGDGGLNLFEILADGRLVQVGEVLHVPGLALGAISAITLRPTALGLEVFVAGEELGITRLTIALDQLALPQTGTADDDTLMGGGDEDLLQGGSGDDALEGNAGDDILSDGAGADVLSGGAGADLFVLDNDAEQDVITDFQNGIDQLDLSAWRGLYGHTGLTISPTATGAMLSWGAERLIIQSSNGQSLQASAFDATDFQFLWHAAQVVRGQNGEILGSAADDLLFGTAADDSIIGSDGADSIYGGAGRDEVDYVAATGGVRIDLLNRSVNSGMAAGQLLQEIEMLTGSDHADTIAGCQDANVITLGTGHDLANGRLGSDTLRGGEGDDTLQGGAGADRLEGGDGFDTLTYADALTGVYVDLEATALNSGDAAGDSFDRVEAIQGSNHADTLVANAGANQLAGYSGHDLLSGRGGSDTLWAHDGNDTLQGGADADVLDGGAGMDFASYGDALAGIAVNLATGRGTAGYSAGDVLISIESVHGSVHSDVIVGSAMSNTVIAYAGDDLLATGAGADVLLGGEGIDTLQGGSGADTMDGGAGFDIVSYGDSPTGIRLDLLIPGLGTGYAAGDVLTGVEGVHATNAADTISGTAGANLVFGYSAADLIAGRGGNDSLWGHDGDDTLIGGTGADRLDGGAGVDVASYGDAAAAVWVDLQNWATNSGDAAGDQLFGIEGLHGSNFADVLFGDGQANSLTAYAGNDRLDGRDGRDTMQGNDGNDTLTGGWGDDMMAGGAGADVFEFAPGSGRDVIADFQDNVDALVLNASLWGGAALTPAEVLKEGNWSLTGRGLCLTLSATDQIEFVGIWSAEVLLDDLLILA